MTKIQALPVRVPLEVPVLAPQLEIRYRDYLLVELQCSDGTSGIGFSYIGTGGARSTAIAFEEFVMNVVLGADPTNPEEIQQKLKFTTRIQGRGGIVANALSAVDIALWDRNARAAGLSLSKFISSEAKESVPAYASGGYLTGKDDTGKLEREIKSNVDQGFESMKLKCAFGTYKEDVHRVTSARRMMGDDTILMLDAYNRWTAIEEAVPSVKAYQDVNPYWVEDPFEPDLLDELVGLVKEVPCNLATGEFYFSPAAFQTMANQKAVGVFQAEAPRCGGITDWLKIADIAEKNGVEMSPCWFHDLHVHLVAASPAAKYVEYFPTFEILNFGVLIDKPLVAKDGMIQVPEAPGLGFNFKTEVIERFAITKAIVARYDKPTRVAT